MVSGYGVNNLNEYTTAAGFTYTYDLEGNPISRSGPGGTTIYRYDIQNRLVSIRSPGDAWDYHYNALGALASETHNGQATNYLVDPTGIGNVEAEYDGNNTLVAHYTRGAGLVGRVSADGSTSFYDFDATGSTVGLTNSGGSYTDRYSYLPFGEALGPSASSANPFQYSGQFGVLTDGSGLDFMRARFYDATLGRFLNRDPIGRSGGDNRFSYAANSPLNLADPSGLTPLVVIIEGEVFAAELLDGVSTTAGALANTALVSGEAATLDTLAANYLGALGATSFPGTAGLPSAASLGLQTGSAVAPEAEAGLTVAPAAGGAGVLAELAEGGLYGLLAAEIVVLVLAGGSVLYAEHLGHLPQCPNLGPLNFLNGNAIACDDTPTVTSQDIKGQTSTRVVGPNDPNFLAGPVGYGPGHFVAADTTLPFVIGFENKPDSSAPALVVAVTQQLDASLDWSTFQLGNFGFGGRTYSIPAGLTSYRARIDATDTVGVYVDVAADFDIMTGLLTWTLTAIDPITLDRPIGNPLEGFLPANVNDPQGVGIVSYSVKPRAGLASGTIIGARASIVFDQNDAIATDPYLVTIDSAAPTSTVGPLPPVTYSTDVMVSWSGQDDPRGSGLSTFDVYNSDDGGPFTLWLAATSATFATFVGQFGHTYGFYSVATDHVGNVQATPTSAQATTQLAGHAPTTVHLSANMTTATYGDALTFSVDVTSSQPGLPGGTVQFFVDGSAFGTSVSLAGGHATSPTLTTLSAGTHSITAAYSGDSNFDPGPSDPLAEIVRKAHLIVTADPKSMAHFDPVPTLTYRVSGFRNGETTAVLAGDAGLTTTATASSPAGDYPIIATIGTLGSANYDFVFQDATLSVRPKVLDVRVRWGSRSMSLIGLGRDLPFDNISAIDVLFSDDVIVDAGDLRLTGLSTTYGWSGFHYDPASHLATWSLPTALGIDHLMLALDGDDATLDGHDGARVAPGLYVGNLALAFDVLPGDFNGDRVVNSQDLALVSNQVRGIGDPAASYWVDFNGDGVVDINDYLIVKKQVGSRLP